MTSYSIIIRSCDSHDARVSKLNARFFISKLPDAKNYIVTSHGLVKRKVASDGGNGSAVAGTEAGIEEKGANGGMSDNEEGEAKNNHDEPVIPEVHPTVHKAGRDGVNNGLEKPDGTRGGGRGGNGRGGTATGGRGGSASGAG